MERPVQSCLDARSSFSLACDSRFESLNGGVRSRGGQTTVDHADIRGSSLARLMLTIRRELPLTRLAGRNRIKEPRVLLPRLTSTPGSCRSRFQASVSGGDLRLAQILALRRRPDRPDEAHQLARDSGDHLACRFALRAEPQVAPTQAQLRLPCDFEHARVKVRLQCALAVAEPRLMAIVVGGFDEHASQAAVSGLRDG